MRLIALGSAVLLTLSALDIGAIAGQTSDALRVQSTQSSPRRVTADADFLAGSSLHTRLLTALAGGAVGAGLGFFASQVFTSDWDTDTEHDVDRRPWAAVGGSIGFAVGFSFPLSGRGGSAPPVRAAPRGGPPPITADEMDGTGVRTAYEAVELLRPDWLIPRGSHTFREVATQRIRAYLDDVELGGVEALREVNAHDIASIHFLDTAAATYRWGAGHSHGAILVLTEDGSSGGVRVGGGGNQLYE